MGREPQTTAAAASPKLTAARESLPAELRQTFEDHVAAYKFAALKHYGGTFVSYAILADLVRDRWQCE